MLWKSKDVRGLLCIVILTGSYGCENPNRSLQVDLQDVRVFEDKVSVLYQVDNVGTTDIDLTRDVDDTEDDLPKKYIVVITGQVLMPGEPQNSGGAELFRMENYLINALEATTHIAVDANHPTVSMTVTQSVSFNGKMENVELTEFDRLRVEAHVVWYTGPNPNSCFALASTSQMYSLSTSAGGSPDTAPLTEPVHVSTWNQSRTAPWKCIQFVEDPTN